MIYELMLTLISYSLNFPEIRCPVQVIRSTLVYVIIQPVRIQVVGMGPPGEEWFVVWIVIFVIVLRDFNRQTLGKVSLIFAIKVTRSYSGCPITKILRPPSAIARNRPASSLSARTVRSLHAWISAIGTSVCLECGARNTSSKPRTSGILRFSTLCWKSPNIFLSRGFSPGHKNDKDWPALPNRERSWKSHASQSNP